jgi:hypothetical protein
MFIIMLLNVNSSSCAATVDKVAFAEEALAMGGCRKNRI